MKFRDRLIDFALDSPKKVTIFSVLLALLLGSQIPRITIDTDPENMLPHDQPDRMFHDHVKEDFALYDMVVVGVINESHPEGVFNPHSLARIYELTREIEKIDGVIRQDLLSLASVDDIQQGGPGVVRFSWMMPEPPQTEEEALEIRDAAKRNPVLFGTLVSEDGKAAGIYVPIKDKSESYRIASEIEKVVAGFDGEEQFHLSGLPVAEDTFGVEMFKQMAIAAPLAGLIVFLLMWFFFKSLALIVSPMIVAMLTVITTMGLLIGLGFTVHIMSSMIPIFLMPIAVVDSVHILSEFADRYGSIGDKRKTVQAVMKELFKPMLYTSMTSAVGFASLAFAPIPPVRVFGLFVAFGIMLAFLLTITFIPAYIAMLSDKRIAQLRQDNVSQPKQTWLGKWLGYVGPHTITWAKPVIAFGVLILIISLIGITKIEINDNPVRWFRKDHRIRVADRALNEHFGGTYNAYLVLRQEQADEKKAIPRDRVETILTQAKDESGIDLTAEWQNILAASEGTDGVARLEQVIEAVYDAYDLAEDDRAAEVWDEVLAALEQARADDKPFQDPELLEYVERVQSHLGQSELVGKSNSIVDIIKTVHRELREADPQYFSIPPSSNAVAQTLLSYQSSHRPQDLWHFLTPDYRAANIWLQLKSGDNHDMVEVTEHLQTFLAKNPLPEGVSIDWAGLTYINVVWQNEMVNGMLNALLGSFIIVFIMMAILFRSLWYGLLAMLPLSLTILFIYGLIGWAGKEYDMPIAVLSSLTLGLSVDFAIHFLQRAIELHKEHRDWQVTIHKMFAEPARAISRNAIVIAIGFLPLLLSPLIPYNTVGIFLATIMIFSCTATLAFLPSMMEVLKKRLGLVTESAGE